MKKNKKILLLTTLISLISFGNLGRDDLNWSDYEDFGMNKGKFVVGRKGINIYKKDGTLSGVIEKPMINFDGVVDAGYLSFWGDPQIMTGVEHVGLAINKTLIKRHMRSDVELSEGFVEGVKKQKENINEKDKIYNKYSENYITDYMVDYRDDYAIIKNTKIAFDGYITETLQNFINEIKSGNLLARVGAGSNYTATDIGVEVWNGKGSYGRIAGGLNVIGPRNEIWRTGVVNNFTLYLNKDPKTPIDSGTKSGDSGSPIFMWSEEKNKWIIVASNSAGVGRYSGGYGKGSLLRGSVEEVKKYTDAITDEVITDGQNITIEDSKLKWNNIERDPNREDEVLKGIRAQGIVDGKRGLTTIIGKNQIFDTENANINVVGENNTKAVRFEFKKSATISGDGKLETAGFIVEDGATLTYKMSDTKDNTVRKVGKGTLIMKGTSQNEGELNVGGEGVTILDNEYGYAASHIRLALGQKVILNRENQLNNNNIYFGLKGGTLELKGQNLEFNDIYHIDSYANIANKEGAEKSTFTFNQGKNRVFLGSFLGNMDLNYNPENVVENARWDLRGNTEISGNLNIEKGKLSISGDNILHGFDLVVGENEYSRASFKSDNINIKENASLNINRASEVESNINVSNNSLLKIEALGRVLVEKDEKPDYIDAPKEEDINKILVKGNINLENNANTNLVINLENNNKAIIESKISGEIKAEKTGSGLVELKNEANDVVGEINILEGKIWVKNKETLSNILSNIAENGTLEVDNVTALSDILKSVTTTSTGILSVGNDIILDEEYAKYENLFIGTSKDIVIGLDNMPINPKIRNINVGGDGGRITLKGLEFDDTSETGIERNITVGKENSTGTVIIDKIVQKDGQNTVNVVVKNGYNFDINEVISERKFIDLEYGSSTDYIFNKNTSDTSEGFLTLSKNDKNVEVIKKSSLGVKKDEEVTINNITANDVYRFSGEGKLNVELDRLENKDIIVDGQYREGGIISLSSLDNSYVGNINIIGNKNNENRGNITLKIAKDGTLGENNNITIKDGGILDLNATTLKANISTDTNENGTMINSSLEKAKLILNSNENIVLKNKFLNNIDIEKNGTSSLELTNVDNNLGTEDNKSNIVVNGGKLIHSVNEALGVNNEIILNNSSSLEILANRLDASILVNDGSIKVEKDNEDKVLRNLKLEKDTSIEFKDNNTEDTSQRLHITKLSLNDNTLFINNQNIFISSVDTKGKLNLTDSIFKIEDVNNDILTKEKIEEVKLNGDKNTLEFLNDEKVATINTEIVSNENNNLEIDKLSQDVILENNFKKFKGSLSFSDKTSKVNKIIKYNLNSENKEDREIAYNIVNDGKYINISNQNLIFKKLNEFSGEIVGENGNIVLDGENALSNRENDSMIISVKNDNNIILKSENDLELKLITFKNDGSSNNQLIKEGNSNLLFKDEESLKVINFDSIDIKEGDITLEKNILSENSKYIISENSNLILELSKEKEFISNIEGKGNLIKNSENEVLINSSKLNNEGKILINSGILTLNQLEDKILSQNISGIGTLKITGEKELELSNNIDTFKGNILVIENSKLAFNGENINVDKLSGSGIVSNKNENSNLILKNNTEFTGNIYSDKGNIDIVSTESTNISKFSLGNGNITLNLKENIDLRNKEFENLATGKLIKDGENEIVLDKISLENIKNLEIKNSNVNIDENSNEKIEANIEIKEKGNLNFNNQNLYLSNVINEGNIDVINQSLEIEKYESNNGTITIEKDEIDENIVTIGDVNSNINVKLRLSDNILESLKKARLELVDSKKGIKIVNLDEYNKDKNYKLISEHNEIFGIYSILEPKTLNTMYILNELNDMDYDNNKLSYIRNLAVKYINNSKFDREYNELENTKYMSSLSANGVELLAEFSDNKNNISINPNMYLAAIRNKLETDVETQDIYETSYNQLIAKAGLGLKHKDFDISINAGIIKTDISDGKNILNLTHRLNLGYNKEYSLDAKNKLTYINNLGYIYNPIIFENISLNNEKVSNIKFSTPFKIYYETGLKLENDKFSLEFLGEYRKNTLDMSIINEDEIIENPFKENAEFSLKTKYLLNIFENLRFNIELNSKIKKNENIKFIKTGLEYKW